jgi:hypothetical protein
LERSILSVKITTPVTAPMVAVRRTALFSHMTDPSVISIMDSGG